MVDETVTSISRSITNYKSPLAWPKSRVLSHFVIKFSHFEITLVALCNYNRPSHFVINLKWMVGGQVSPIISIIVDNNNNNNNNNHSNSNNNNNNNNNNNIPLNGFQHQFLKWGWRKVFTSTAAFRLQDLCREVQLFLFGLPGDHDIVSITTRGRNNGSLFWNLAAIRIVGCP